MQNFSQFVAESVDLATVLKDVKPENQTFVKDFLAAMEGIDYTLESSRRELLNGTLKIRMKDLDLVKQAMKDRDIEESDINPADLKDFYKRWTDPASTTSKDLALYTVYSRGGIRVLSGSSDAFKFGPVTGISTAVEWLKNHFTVWAIQNVTNIISNKEKFAEFKKGYDLDFSKIKDMFSPTDQAKMDKIIQAYPKMYTELSPDINFMAFVAMTEGTLVKVEVVTWGVHPPSGSGAFPFDRINFEIDKPSSNVLKKLVFGVTNPWKVGTKRKEIKMRLEKSWSVNNSNGWGHGSSFKQAAKDADVPAWLLDAYTLISKKDRDHSALFHDLRGSIAGSRFGV